MSSTSDSPTNSLVALSQNLANIIERVGKSIVALNGRRFSCSGIYWREGIIVTSAENIKRGDTTVTLPNGDTAPVTLLGSDRTTDVAVFKSDLELSVAPIDSNCELKVGHLAIAVGRDPARGLFASQGIVSTVGDPWRSTLGGYIDRFIRLDLNFYSGSGGSALVNSAGQIVGFNTTGPRRSVLTIPAATVDHVVTQLLERGHISRGYLGLAMQPVNLPDALVTEFSLQTQQGLIVLNVEPESPAAEAGILLGDILTKIETTTVAKLRDLQTFLEPQNVGKAVVIELIRGGKLQNISVTIGDRGNMQQ